jgi:hypothetical protein
MPENYFVLARRQAKQDLLNFLRQPREEELDVETLLAQFSYKQGYRVALLRMWLEELEQAKLIKIDHGSVC